MQTRNGTDLLIELRNIVVDSLLRLDDSGMSLNLLRGRHLDIRIRYGGDVRNGELRLTALDGVWYIRQWVEKGEEELASHESKLSPANPASAPSPRRHGPLLWLYSSQSIHRSIVHLLTFSSLETAPVVTLIPAVYWGQPAALLRLYPPYGYLWSGILFLDVGHSPHWPPRYSVDAVSSSLPKATLPVHELGVAALASTLAGFGVVALFCSVGVNV